MDTDLTWVLPQNVFDEDRRKPLKEILPLVDLALVLGFLWLVIATACVAVDLFYFKDDDFNADNRRAQQRDSALTALPNALESFNIKIDKLENKQSLLSEDQKKMAAGEAAILRKFSSTSVLHNNRALPRP